MIHGYVLVAKLIYIFEAKKYDLECNVHILICLTNKGDKIGNQ